MSAVLNYEGLKKLAGELGRPAHAVYVLAPHNDPFYIGPARTVDAEWFERVWRRLGRRLGHHYRRIHYLLVSQAEPIEMPDGKRYENTVDCWIVLCKAARDAVALGLVPPNAFSDNRNDAPIIHLIEPVPADVYIANDWPGLFDFRMPALPSLSLDRPTVPQRYHLEIWAEKTTMNDILVPLARGYGMNIITGSGELSATQCRELVDRAIASGRPVRILYISDFDPAGQSMPVAVARKIEHEIYKRGVSLDIQVRPIVLTHDQCVEHQLPRTPIKETEKRLGAFEQRFGEGATELDALEALHPGLLREIILKEIARYWYDDHSDDVAATCEDIESELDEITADAIADQQSEIDALTDQWKEIADAYRAWQQLAKPIWQAISDRLDENQPTVDDVQWAESAAADEDDDPLFDSTRDYIEQIDRYKEHQGKPTERRSKKRMGGA
jgi:hypothetical protein